MVRVLAKLLSSALCVTAAVVSVLPVGAQEAALRVHTFASPDPDSVNSYFVEVDGGLLSVSTQRTFSEARRAVAFARRLDKPVVAIVIPVAHTDHFGGLTVFAEAFPQARIMASSATIESMRTDGQGYIASRKKALGDDFPSQQQVNERLPQAVLKNGATLKFGATEIRVIDLPWNNAPSNTLLHFPKHGTLLTSELVEISVTAFMRDADLDTWISQVDSLATLASGAHTVLPAHGAAGPFDNAVRQQLAYLRMHRDLLDEALRAPGGFTPDRQQSIVASIDQTYPDYAQVARLARAELIGLNLQWQAQKRRAK